MENQRLTMMDRMVVVTDRHIFMKKFGEDENLWKPAFLAQIRFLASLHPRMIVLREKDMEEEEYRSLAIDVKSICDEAQVTFAVHYFQDILEDTGAGYLHLPLWKMREPGKIEAAVGTSVHSVAEAREAEALGASWLFAGNVYETTCKEGLAGRGLEYLRAVSEAVAIPVYGIGGVNMERMPEILETGAAGGCMMSGFMNLIFVRSILD